MSLDPSCILAEVPTGRGRALDVGGGAGHLGPALRSRGWDYVNLDPAARGPDAVVGDAQSMPFDDESFDLAIASDMLQMLVDPHAALREMHRVMRPGARLVIWVPFMHPFIQHDYYRFTPKGLENSLERAGLRAQAISSPMGPITVIATMIATAVARAGQPRLASGLRRGLIRADLRFGRSLPDAGYSAGYLVSAVRPLAA